MKTLKFVAMGLVLFTSLTALAQSENINWDKCPKICDTLVFYATEHGKDEIPKTVPVYVAKELSKIDPEGKVFLSDIVPYATLLTKEQMLEELNMKLDQFKKDPKIHDELMKIKAWVQKNAKIKDYVSYVLEPASIAGHGNAHVLKEAAMKKK